MNEKIVVNSSCLQNLVSWWNYWKNLSKVNIAVSISKYTVIQNFGFSLPKHSVLKILPKLPIFQLKFRVKPTKHSSQYQLPRSFVFGKIYKFYTKLRNSLRNILGIGQWITYHLSCVSVGRLVHWSPLWTLSPKSPRFKPQTGQKRRTKNLMRW
jgi:hypothetical protein